MPVTRRRGEKKPPPKRKRKVQVLGGKSKGLLKNGGQKKKKVKWGHDRGGRIIKKIFREKKALVKNKVKWQGKGMGKGGAKKERGVHSIWMWKTQKKAL